MLELLSFSPPGWGGALLRGAVVTVEIAVAAYLVGIAFGLVGAAAKLSGNSVLAGLAELYTTVVRAVPELLLIILLFYTGTTALNDFLAWIGLAGGIRINPFAAAIAVLGIVQGAYQTEVFRGAIIAIPRGQIEAATAFGMSPLLRLRRIILPSMLPNALPGLGNLWLVLIKDTALISVLGFSELLYTGKQAAGSTRHYFLFYMAVGAIYLAMTLVSNALFRVAERSVRRGIVPV